MAFDPAPHPARGIRTLLVLLVLSVYLPALIAAAALVAIQARSNWRQTEDNLLSRTVLLSRALRVRIDGIQSHLERLAEESPADGDGLREFDQAARRAAAAAGLDNIFLIRPSGEQLVNTRVPLGTPLAASSPDVLLESARTGRPTLLNMVRTRTTGRQVVGMAVPVIRAGQVRYVVVGVLEVRRLQELLANTPEGWLSAITDADNVVIARTHAPETYIGRGMTGDLLEHVKREEQGVYTTVALDGTPMLTAFRKPPSVGWTVVMAVPRATLYAAVWRNALLVAAGAAGLLAFGLWVAVRLRGAIVRSVQVLVDEALDPPAHLPAAPLAFAEANDLRARLHGNAMQLAVARRSVERMHAEFQRALVQQMDRRQAQIAVELHDDVGSALAGISLLLAQLRHAVAATALPLLDALQRQVEHAAASVRHLSRGMMPAGEQQGGLPAALEQLALDFGSVDRRCTALARGDFSGLGTEAASQLFRIAQEAVANAVRQPGVTRIRIQLAHGDGDGRLTIDDDGFGYPFDDPEAHSDGVGLRSMRTRAQAVDGRIEFLRSPLGGARVRVTFPMADARPKEGAR